MQSWSWSQPIVSRGSYDLDFVDYDNEWEETIESDYSEETEQDNEENRNILRKKLKKNKKRIRPMLMGKSEQVCSICI